MRNKHFLSHFPLYAMCALIFSTKRLQSSGYFIYIRFNIISEMHFSVIEI